VSRSGGQGSRSVAHGTKPMEQPSLGARPQRGKHPGEGPGW
jgi:hypothetical protein